MELLAVLLLLLARSSLADTNCVAENAEKFCSTSSGLDRSFSIPKAFATIWAHGVNPESMQENLEIPFVAAKKSHAACKVNFAAQARTQSVLSNGPACGFSEPSPFPEASVAVRKDEVSTGAAGQHLTTGLTFILEGRYANYPAKLRLDFGYALCEEGVCSTLVCWGEWLLMVTKNITALPEDAYGCALVYLKVVPKGDEEGDRGWSWSEPALARWDRTPDSAAQLLAVTPGLILAPEGSFEKAEIPKEFVSIQAPFIEDGAGHVLSRASPGVPECPLLPLFQPTGFLDEECMLGLLPAGCESDFFKATGEICMRTLPPNVSHALAIAATKTSQGVISEAGISTTIGVFQGIVTTARQLRPGLGNQLLLVLGATFLVGGVTALTNVRPLVQWVFRNSSGYWRGGWLFVVLILSLIWTGGFFYVTFLADAKKNFKTSSETGGASDVVRVPVDNNGLELLVQGVSPMLVRFTPKNAAKTKLVAWVVLAFGIALTMGIVAIFYAEGELEAADLWKMVKGGWDELVQKVKNFSARGGKIKEKSSAVSADHTVTQVEVELQDSQPMLVQGPGDSV